MPEELALDQAGGDGAAVQFDERPVPARTPVVQSARDELLPGAGLALDEDRRVARRHAGHLVEQLAQRRSATHDLVDVVLAAKLLLQIDVLRLQPVAQPLQFLHRCLQRTLGLHALQLGASARGEDLQYVDGVLGGLQRLGMQHRDVAEHLAGGIAHRHPDIAVGADLLQPRVLGKRLLQAAPRVADMALRDALAGRAEKAVAESFAEAAAFPVSERARFQFTERLGREGVARAKSLRGMPRQGTEEFVADRCRRSFGENAKDLRGRTVALLLHCARSVSRKPIRSHSASQ